MTIAGYCLIQQFNDHPFGNNMFWYIQQISNTTTTKNNGLLALNGMYIAPEENIQYSVDLTMNFRENLVETMVRADFKALDDIVEHKDDTDINLGVNRNFNYAPNFQGNNDSFTFHINTNKRIIIGDCVFSFDNLC